MSDFQFDYSPMERLIDEKITGRKSARNREILKLRFLQGLTFAEIAEKMDMSRRQLFNKIVELQIDVSAMK